LEDALLNVENLTIQFTSAAGQNKAVKDLSFQLRHNESLGIVGESGSGKSVTSLAIMRLLPARNTAVSGAVHFAGRDVLSLTEREMMRLRGAEISMIFQEPMTSLNPLHLVCSQIMENLLRHRKISRKEACERAVELMAQTGISAPEKRRRQYPFEFSGGMCQRAMIAMALACDPRLLIADEPTTALDVTIQAQILDLLKQLKEDRRMSMILITHDLGVVAETCDRIMVMYAGEMMESAKTEDMLSLPLHPYTRGLLAAVPKVQDNGEWLTAIPGTVPDSRSMPEGCPFHPRCAKAEKRCGDKKPPLLDLGEGRQVRCWYCAGEKGQ
jgi:oligopeptide/dipeptide ABC transporter ATP-binding protein